MGVIIQKTTGSAVVRLIERVDGDFELVDEDTNGFSISEGDEVLCEITGSVDNQTLKVYVDGSLVMTSTAIDDNWSAGRVGLIVSVASSTKSFDDFKVGYDTNTNHALSAADDDLQISDDFASNAITLTYDNNGNRKADGLAAVAASAV
jgi:hypothetical protein